MVVIILITVLCGKLLAKFEDFPKFVGAMLLILLSIVVLTKFTKSDYLVDLAHHNLHIPPSKALDSLKRNKFDKFGYKKDISDYSS